MNEGLAENRLDLMKSYLLDEIRSHKNTAEELVQECDNPEGADEHLAMADALQEFYNKFFPAL